DLSAGIHKTDKYLIRFLRNLIHHENHLLKNRELHILYKVPEDDTVNNTDDTVNDTVKSAYNTVLGLIKQDNTITATEISDRLRISLSTAKRRLKELKEKGIVKREGSDKTGNWKVIH
ncbi:MAG: winged helix-turn-helix domain-containing protein, partial [Bacteroidota bacterium]